MKKIALKITSVAMAFLMVMSLFASPLNDMLSFCGVSLAHVAGAATYGDYTYKVLSDGSVEITKYNGSATELVIPSEIEGKSVTRIGIFAFSRCEFLESLTISDNVTSIGDSAFLECSSLTSVVIGNSVTSIGKWVFSRCTSLVSITIPESVKSIGNNAFDNCTSLTSIAIPKSVENIGDNIFKYCRSLVSIQVDINNNYYTSENGVLFNKDKSCLIIYPSGKQDEIFTVSEGVTSINDYAFYNCTFIQSIIIPDSVTNIGYSAFYNCSALESITIPEGVTDIGSYAFYGCKSLLSVNLPSTLKGIDKFTFCLCKSLSSIVIPDNVTYINQDAFRMCESLATINIPAKVTFIEAPFFACYALESINVDLDNYYYSSINGVLFNKEQTTIICCPPGYVGTNYTIPNNVSKIDAYAFSCNVNLETVEIGCNVTRIERQAFSEASIKSVTIPSSVTYIGDSAFGFCANLTTAIIQTDTANMGYGIFTECVSLKEVSFSNTVTNIGPGVFSNCTSLTSVIIPHSVTDIGDDAFFRCTSLESVTIPDGVTRIGDRVFQGCSSLASINIPNSVISIGEDAFYGTPILNNQTTDLKYCNSWLIDCDLDATTATITEGTIGIGDNAFFSCGYLESVTVPNSVKYIGDEAFADCYSLQNIIMPNNISLISKRTFFNCESLTSVDIPDGVKSVGQGAFLGCSSLVDVVIPNSVVKIENEAFSYCTNLAQVKILKNVTEIDSNAFRECSADLTIYCEENSVAEEFAIENDIRYQNIINFEENATLDDCLFTKSSSGIWITGYIGSSSSLILPSVTDDGSVEGIGNHAFFNCGSLVVISVPNTLTTIKECAFKNCKSLKAVIIPDSVTTISKDAFDGCPSDLVIYCKPGSTAEKFAVEHKISYKSIVDSWTIDLGQNNLDGDLPACSYETEREQDEVYYSDLYFGYSYYLSRSPYLLNYNSTTFNSVNKICDDYIKSPKFFLTNLEYSLPLVFDLPEYLKHLSDATGLTTFTYDNALDAANEELAGRLLGENVLAGQFDTEKKWVDGIGKVVKVYDSFEENFDVIEKSDIEIVEAMFVAINDTKVFSYLSSTKIEQIREIVLPNISAIKDILSAGSDALDAAKALVIAMMIEDMRFGVINSVLQSQYKDTALYKGMSRLNQQLRDGYKSYFMDNYLFGNDGLIIRKISDAVADKITDEILGLESGLYKVIGALVELSTWIAFDVLIDVPDLTDVTKALVLREYAEDFFDLLQEKISCFETQFTIDDIKEFEMMFQAYVTTNNLAMETCSKLTLSSNSEYFNEIYQTYKDEDIYALTINSALDALKQIPIEERVFYRYKSWTVPQSVEYEICNGSNSIEPNKFYYIYTNQLPETITVKLGSNLYINSNIETDKIVLHGGLKSADEKRTVIVDELSFANDGAYGTVAKIDIVNCDIYAEKSISITPDASISKMIKVELINSDVKSNGNLTVNPYGVLTISSNSSVYIVGDIVVQAGPGNAFRHCWAYLNVNDGSVFCEGNMSLRCGTWGYGGTTPSAILTMNTEKSIVKIQGDFTATRGARDAVLELNGGSIYIGGNCFLEYNPNSYSSIEGTKTKIYLCGENTQNINFPFISNLCINNVGGVSLDADTYLNGVVNLNGNVIYLNGYKFSYISGGLFDGITEYGDLVISDKLNKIKSIYDGEKEITPIDKIYSIPADNQIHAITITTNSGSKYVNTIMINKHDCIFGEWSTEREPTCDVAGIKTRLCQICKKANQELIPTLPHIYTSTVVPPTYYNQGYTLHDCDNCDYSYKDNYTDKLVLPAVSDFAMCGTSADSISLSWNENSDASGYIIEQYVDGEWVQIADITDNATTEYLVNGLTADTEYQFRIKAYITDGDSIAYSEYSDSISVVTALPAVSGFTSPSKSTTAIRLNWTAGATVSGYIIEQYIDGNWVQITNITDNVAATYKVTDLTPGTEYSFRMFAYTDDNSTDYTEELTISTTMTTVKGFTSPSRSTSAIRLNWSKNAYATGYVIDQYTNSGWIQIADITDSEITTYKVTGLKSGTAYKFRMKAYSVTETGGIIYGNKTATLTVNTQSATVKGFDLRSRSSTALRLKWTKNTAVDGYIIEQMIDGVWTEIADIDDYKTTEYKVTGLEASTSYSFRMKSYSITKYGDRTYSMYTSVLDETTNPSAVSGLRVKSRSDKAIRLAWTANASAGGYLIEQYIDGEWVQIADVNDIATTEYKVTGLASATEYQFRVRSYNMDGETALYSEYKTVSGITL